MKKRILLVEDEGPTATSIRAALSQRFEVTVVTTRFAALQVLADADVVVADVRLDRESEGNEEGLELLADVRHRGLATPVILITQYGDVTKAVRAIKEGAYDFIEKPVRAERLEVLIEKAVRDSRLQVENRYLRAELAQKEKFQYLVGSSPVMDRVQQVIAAVAAAPRTTVLITGERGTGKGLVARAIHDQSGADGPYLTVTCSAFTESLVESELFGVIKNYPGFHRNEALVGKLEAAKGGTLFLDEIGDMLVPLQAKILDVLQSRRFTRVGQTESMPLEARVVAATNKNLHEAIRTGGFRADLFDRLNVVAIEVPSLRDRMVDITALVEHFLCRFNEEMNRTVTGVDEEVQSLFMRYDWPGNVRELEKTIEQAFVLAGIDRTHSLGVRHFPHIGASPPSRLTPLEDELVRELVRELDSAQKTLNDVPLSYQERILKILLDREHGSGPRVATIVGVTSGALRRKLSDWGISTRSFRS